MGHAAFGAQTSGVTYRGSASATRSVRACDGTWGDVFGRKA